MHQIDTDQQEQGKDADHRKQAKCKQIDNNVTGNKFLISYNNTAI